VAADADTQYRMGSITKTFVAVAVLRLRDAGRLDLSDRLGAHVPGSALDDVTVEQLLTHAAGAQAETNGPWWERTPGGDWSELASSPVGQRFRAGRRFHYSNVGYAALGRLLEVHHEAPWFDVVRRTLLDPLGMRRTTPRPEGVAAAGLAVHPFADVLLPEPEHDAGAMAPAGQVWSTVSDLARYAAFLSAGHDDVLPRATLEEMAAPQSATRAGALAGAHGLGVQIARGGSGMTFGHTGSMPGFLAGLFVDPVRRTGAVVVANGTTGLRSDALPIELLESLEASEGTLPLAWRPAYDVPAAVEEVLGVWHWGNTAFAFSWDGREVSVTQLSRGVLVHRFRPQDDGTFLGTVGYHHGERLHVVRNPPDDHGRRSINHLVCETFVYTRTPYDPAAPIPGGHPG
jgi:CubicO group peptidase (beta-lactamase class C family)